MPLGLRQIFQLSYSSPLCGHSGQTTAWCVLTASSLLSRGKLTPNTGPYRWWAGSLCCWTSFSTAEKMKEKRFSSCYWSCPAISSTSSMANFLRYWIPFSVVAHLPRWHIISFLKGYLSFASDRSYLQNLRTCTPFPTTSSMLHYLERNPSSFTSLPSNSGLLLPFSQHRNSKVTMDLLRH